MTSTPIEDIQFRQGPYGTRGAACGTPIPLPGIKAGDALLAVVRYEISRDARVKGLDVSRFTVLDGAIQSETEDTSDWIVHVVWTR